MCANDYVFHCKEIETGGTIIYKDTYKYLWNNNLHKKYNLRKERGGNHHWERKENLRVLYVCGFVCVYVCVYLTNGSYIGNGIISKIWKGHFTKEHLEINRKCIKSSNFINHNNTNIKFSRR